MMRNTWIRTQLIRAVVGAVLLTACSPTPEPTQAPEPT
jgi:hypothetical protein